MNLLSAMQHGDGRTCVHARRVRTPHDRRCMVGSVPDPSDDVPGGDGGSDVATPTIVMVASGRRPASLVLAPPAELGRRIAAGPHNLEVADERMSRDHAVVSWERGGWVIRDLDSRNGTFVDGERVVGEVRRRTDAILRLGHTVFVLLVDGRGHPAPDGEPVIGPELARAHDAIRRHATSDTILIQGETGAGKDLAARMYHEAGPRRAGPFITVRCTAIPEGLADRLLFGARKGAVPGEIDAFGHFQLAQRGTLFFDDITALEPAVQAKLLRAIETRQVMPIGAGVATRIDIGIAAACHRELRAAVAERRFRADLCERLARTTVRLPPLRDRKVDLARLVQHEVAAAGRDLTPHAKLIEACLLRPWPGNADELRAAVRRAAAIAVGNARDQVRPEDLPRAAGMSYVMRTIDTAVDRRVLSLDVVDRDAVTAALTRANGVVHVAARMLGMHRTELYRLMYRLGIVLDEEQ